MAEAIGRHHLGSESLVVVSSAGTVAVPGDAATDHAIAVLRDRGIDLSRHRARSLANVPRPDLVLGMAQEHLIAARHRYPDLPRGTIRLLDHPRSVPDPYGHPIETYRSAADQIEQAVIALDLS